ncbi:MAG: hypothetical protein RBT86_05685 [Azospira sp.]|jgi:hypothetical protein|nr:hypothetical protein [Azospira sp.]
MTLPSRFAVCLSACWLLLPASPMAAPRLLPKAAETADGTVVAGKPLLAKPVPAKQQAAAKTGAKAGREKAAKSVLKRPPKQAPTKTAAAASAPRR